MGYTEDHIQIRRLYRLISKTYQNGLSYYFFYELDLLFVTQWSKFYVAADLHHMVAGENKVDQSLCRWCQ